MINNINISSLKSVTDLRINCSNLNLFVGTNSSGKSTVLQSILLVSQNIDKKVGLNGQLVSMGDFREAKSINIQSNEIKLKIEEDDGEVSISIAKNDEDIDVKADVSNEVLVHKLCYKYNNLFYLSCHRIGGHDTYSKNMNEDFRFGLNGEYCMNYLMVMASVPIKTEIIKSPIDYTLQYQLNWWLDYIIGAKVSAHNITGTDILKVSYSVIDGFSMRPKNIGSGISYLVSILIICLASKQDDIIIIENPEIHLHPLAQSKVCEFLYFIADKGRQIFVETHSDHIFNGVRVGIANNTMDTNKISVNFLSLDENYCTQNTKIIFGKRGKIINQQKNLFDQFEMDLDSMLGL